MQLPPALVIHGLDHARLALGQGRAVTLLSAPEAAGFAGAGWWRAVIRQAGVGAEAPDVLDCGDGPGWALEALSLGCRILILRPCPAWEGVAARATALGTTLLADRPPALDLAAPGAARRMAAWLAG